MFILCLPKLVFSIYIEQKKVLLKNEIIEFIIGPKFDLQERYPLFQKFWKMDFRCPICCLMVYFLTKKGEVSMKLKLKEADESVAAAFLSDQERKFYIISDQFYNFCQ